MNKSKKRKLYSMNKSEKRKDYIAQSRIFHPDKNPDCIERANKKFQKLANYAEGISGGKSRRKSTRKNRKSHKKYSR